MKKRHRSPEEMSSKELWKRIKRLERALEDRQGSHERSRSRRREKYESPRRERRNSRREKSKSRGRERSRSRRREDQPGRRDTSGENDQRERTLSSSQSCSSAYDRDDIHHSEVSGEASPVAGVSGMQVPPTVDSAAVENSSTVPTVSAEQLADTSAEAALDPDILEVMGDRLMTDRIFAPAVHSDFAIRFQEIIKGGLPEEEFKKIAKEFYTAENCRFMDPPKLNPEVKASLKKAIIERDDRIKDKQSRSMVALAGLTTLLNMIIKSSSDDRVPMIKMVNGIIKIYAGIQHDESEIRRRLILKNIDISMRETLKAENAIEWLFGEKLDERVKAVKTLESSSKTLKPKQSFDQSKDSKNLMGPPRRSSYKPKIEGGQRLSSNGNQKYHRTRKQSQPRSYQTRSKSRKN